MLEKGVPAASWKMWKLPQNPKAVGVVSEGCQMCRPSSKGVYRSMNVFSCLLIVLFRTGSIKENFPPSFSNTWYEYELLTV